MRFFMGRFGSVITVKEKQVGIPYNRIIFKSFLLAGTFTFAGGIAMLPTLKRDLVDKYELMTQETFYDYAAMAQAVPGIIGLNFALLMGKKVNGKVGMALAAFGTIFPAFSLMLVATILAQFIPEAGPIQFAMLGVRAASTSAVFMAAYSLAQYLVKTQEHWIMVLISFFAVGILGISSPYVILVAALIGFIYHKMEREL